MEHDDAMKRLLCFLIIASTMPVWASAGTGRASGGLTSTLKLTPSVTLFTRSSWLDANRLKICFNLLGREVAVLVNEPKAPGSYTVSFDASELASGVYFYRLTAENFVQSRKMLLVR